MSNNNVKSAKGSFSGLLTAGAIILSVILGYIVWKYIMGSPSNFENGNPEGNPLPGNLLAVIYKGGFIVPFLIGANLTVIIFAIERIISISRAKGKGKLTKFVRNIQEMLRNDQIEEAIVACDKQRGSLANAAYAESYSSHPIALSILKAYKEDIDFSKIEDYEEIAGHGISVKVDGNEVFAGSPRLMIREKIKYSDNETLGTVVHVAINKKYAGYIVISDEVKEDSAHAIRELKALGIKKTIMLTGDSKAVGDKIGKQLGIDEVYSELLPADKVEKFEQIERQKSTKGKVVFVGDGINDAPVLARADIGIGMGGLGSDAAIEAADIVIMTDEPSKIVTAIKIAKRTRQIVFQNIGFAFGVKFIVLVLGAFGVATMWEAVFADVGVAVIAIFNAMRVLNVKNI